MSLDSRSKSFETITNLNLNKKDFFSRNHLPELIKESVDSRFLFIENAESSEDMLQFNDLCRTLNTKFHYGLSKLQPNILSWVNDVKTDKPHNAQEYPQMFFAIEFLIEHFGEALNYEDMYLVLGELWSDHYNLINAEKKQKEGLQERSNYWRDIVWKLVNVC